jgi:hypothetical protein
VGCGMCSILHIKWNKSTFVRLRRHFAYGRGELKCCDICHFGDAAGADCLPLFGLAGALLLVMSSPL